VVAPHWRVANAATVDLEASFYAAWREDGDAVGALAAAQRAFLDASQGDPGGHLRALYAEPAHPYWWAAWQAFG
jgi:CHAT domain-containing protein